MGKRPDTGKGPEVGKRPDTGKSPDVGKRPDTGKGPEVGKRPDTGKSPDVGQRPDTGKGPDVGKRPDTGKGPRTDGLGLAGAAVLMLADARFPAGGHAHSGGLEGAVNDGAVFDVPSLTLFLRGRLATSGVVAAALAAAACGTAARGEPGRAWPRLDAEADARTPSPAQRDASRRQGRALLRAALAAWPAPWLAGLAAAGPPPHHAIVLGATAAAAGCRPGEAALIAAYLTVTGPASAAVRLLALDPIEVSAAIAGLAGHIEAAAERGAAAGGGPADGAELPYPSAPALDLYAEAQARAEVRLFAS